MGNLDQTMHDLYEAVSNSPDIDKLAISMSQRKWLEKRNECKGSDDTVMNCLYVSYRAMYIELSKPYDKQHLTGLFANKSGTMDSVLFPDKKLLY